MGLLLELKTVVCNSLGLLFVMWYTIQYSVSKTAGKMVPKLKKLFKGFMVLRKDLQK